MAEFLDSGIVQLVLAALVAVVILGLFGWLKFRRDEKVVADFLKESGLERRQRFRKTVEISSATRLHEDRVRSICSKSTRIKKTSEHVDAWKLHR